MLLDNQNHLLENTDTNGYDIIDESLLCDESKSNVLLESVDFRGCSDITSSVGGGWAVRPTDDVIIKFELRNKYSEFVIFELHNKYAEFIIIELRNEYPLRKS